MGRERAREREKRERQSDRATERQSYRATELQSYRATKRDRDRDRDKKTKRQRARILGGGRRPVHSCALCAAARGVSAVRSPWLPSSRSSRVALVTIKPLQQGGQAARGMHHGPARGKDTEKSGDVFRVGIFWMSLGSPHVRPMGGASYVRRAKRNRIGPHWGEIERLAARTCTV